VRHGPGGAELIAFGIGNVIVTPDAYPTGTTPLRSGRLVAEVGAEITRVTDLPAGRRPFRSRVDPSRDGSEVVSVVADRVRAPSTAASPTLLPDQAHA
jgi:hypothetical protein